MTKAASRWSVVCPAFLSVVLPLAGMAAEGKSNPEEVPTVIVPGQPMAPMSKPQEAMPAVPMTKAIPATPLIKPTRTTTLPKRPGPEALKGNALPGFEMRTIDEKTISSESLRGKVLLIDFWATWCAPCRRAAPVLQRLHERFADVGLVVIGANTSERDAQGQPVQTVDRARDYAREHQYGYTFTYGADAFKNTCGVRGLPTMIIVDREGLVRDVVVGYALDLEEKLEKIIRPLLE